MSKQEQDRINNEPIDSELLRYILVDENSLYKIIFDGPLYGSLIDKLSGADELFVSRNLGEITNFGEGINSMHKPTLGDPQQVGALQIAQDLNRGKLWYIIDSPDPDHPDHPRHPISPGFDKKITLTNQENVYGITLRGERGVLAKLQPEAQRVIGKRLQLLKKDLSPKDHRPIIEQMALPESAEKPYDFLAVIADDRPSEGDQTQIGITKIISDRRQNAGVVVARSSIDFFNTALRGKKGLQADVVLIDDDYGGGNSWKFDPEKIVQLAQAVGVDFSPFTPQRITRRDNTHYWKINDISYDLYSLPNSINYALLLRALGYKGKIIVVSSDPPQAGAFMRAADEIISGVPGFYPGSPVDGMILKTYFRGEGLLYASEIIDRKWVQKSAPEDTELEALNSLFNS